MSDSRSNSFLGALQSRNGSTQQDMSTMQTNQDESNSVMNGDTSNNQGNEQQLQDVQAKEQDQD
jgi:hypothetical protein